MKLILPLAALLIFLITLATPASRSLASDAPSGHGISSGSRALTANRTIAAQPASAWGRLVIYIREQQQTFYRALAKAVKTIKAENTLASAWSLVVLSFLYGVFHAAGPGHGKAVISAYLLANERQIRRGILLAFLSSLVQALSAIALVTIVVLIFSAAGREAQKLVPPLELASYALVCAIGLYMLWKAIAPVMVRPHASTGAHGHDHHHDGACGHTHMPAPGEIDAGWSIGRAASIVFAVGLRPCSGAVLVLLFANAIGLYAAGVGATFAMSLGTALTVSALAVLALTAKGIAVRLAGAREGRLTLVYRGFSIAGSLAVFLLGLLLLIGSWGAPRPLI